jgi:hypothetical protein
MTPTLRPLATMPEGVRRAIRGVLTDIDDTLSTHGRLTAEAYAAMERLRAAGRLVIPITGRPAGWCDHIARMWPVDAWSARTARCTCATTPPRASSSGASSTTRRRGRAHRDRLAAIGTKIVAEVPGCALASDQHLSRDRPRHRFPRGRATALRRRRWTASSR